MRAAAGDAMAIRVDANGVWRRPTRRSPTCARWRPVGVELCEEPVHGIATMRAVRARSPVPVAMDETAAERGALSSGAADAVCLKISRCGGISGLLRDARAARAAGTKVYVASNFDGPLGIAAGVHAAAGAAGVGAGGATAAWPRCGRSRGTRACSRPATGSSPCPGPGLLAGGGTSTAAG